MNDSAASSDSWLAGSIVVHHEYGGEYRPRRWSHLSPNGLVLAEYLGTILGPGDRRVWLRDVITGDLIYTLNEVGQKDAENAIKFTTRVPWHSSRPVKDLYFSPNGSLLTIRGDYTSQSEVWNVDTGELVQIFDERITLSLDNKLAVVEGEETKVRYGGSRTPVRMTLEVRETETGSLNYIIDNSPAKGSFPISISARGFSPDGRFLATTCWTGRVEVDFWDTATWERIKRFIPRSSRNYKLIWSHDGRWMAITSGTGDEPGIQILDGRSFDVVRELRPFLEEPLVAFSPDGSKLVTCTIGRGAIQAWRVETGEQIWTTNAGRHVHTLTFSSDGSLVATRGVYSVTILDTRTGQPIHVLKDYDDADTDLRFSPDGRLLILKGKNGRVRIVGPAQ